MQEKEEIISEIAERIKKIIDFQKDNKNRFALKLGYTRSQTIYDIINCRSAPSYDFFYRFSKSAYADLISLDWLISGEGEMLKKKRAVTAPEPTSQKETVPLQERDRLIEALEEIIRTKDQTIKTLEQSLQLALKSSK